jgi:hypothetical protein
MFILSVEVSVSPRLSSKKRGGSVGEDMYETSVNKERETLARRCDWLKGALLCKFTLGAGPEIPLALSHTYTRPVQDAMAAPPRHRAKTAYVYRLLALLWLPMLYTASKKSGRLGLYILAAQ